MDALHATIDTYTGYMKYQVPSVSTNITSQLTPATTPEGIPAICVRKPSILSANIEDLQAKITSDLMKFNSLSPNTSHLLHNILSLNGISKTSLLLPSTSDHCMKVLIEAAGHIIFNTVTYIRDEETYFTTFKNFDSFITNANNANNANNAMCLSSLGMK